MPTRGCADVVEWLHASARIAAGFGAQRRGTERALVTAVLLGPLLRPRIRFRDAADFVLAAGLRSGGRVPSAAWLRVFPLRKCLQNRPPSPRRDVDEITRRRTAEALAIFRRQSDL